jgi:hypothetical protein
MCCFVQGVKGADLSLTVYSIQQGPAVSAVVSIAAEAAALQQSLQVSPVVSTACMNSAKQVPIVLQGTMLRYWRNTNWSADHAAAAHTVLAVLHAAQVQWVTWQRAASGAITCPDKLV